MPDTDRDAALRALNDWLQNQAEHGDECPFWRMSGTDADCTCGLLTARTTAANALALTPPTDGVMVPREPTYAMVEAAERAVNALTYEVYPEEICTIYREMIAAAPKQKEQP